MRQPAFQRSHPVAISCHAALLVCVAAAPAGAQPASPHRPSLLLTRDGIAGLAQRVETQSWAKEPWRELVKRVDAALEQPVALPPRGSNWYHWYVCPEHGNRLVLGRKIGDWEWEHTCPVDRKLMRSDPARVQTDYDGCAIQGVHGSLAHLLRDCGLVYQVTREPRYAKRAREILLAYADRYADYPLHTTRNEPKIGGGRVGSQTLDESTWLIPVCQGADLVWDTLSDDERKIVAERLLLSAAREVILPHRMSVHNIQCWKNSAVGLVGFLLKDAELIREAIDDTRSGFRVQVEKGVGPDGLWWEGAWGYHFYTMSALWPLAEAARNHDVDLYTGAFRKMFDAPLKLCMPNGVLPDFNDSGAVNLRGQASLYELAYARYSEPKYLSVLKPSERKDSLALLFGVDPLPAAPAREAASANHPASGYAILMRGQGQSATWLCLDYGPHGGGHGHPDKLSFVLYSRGQVLAPDAGITSYGSPLHGSWFRTTVAHNTLCIDGENQKPAEGRCLAFGSRHGVDYVSADSGEIHKDVRFVRTAALIGEDLVVFIDHVGGAAEHELDIAFHHRGEWGPLPAGAPWSPPDVLGYRHLADCTARDARGAKALTVRRSNGAETALTLDAETETQLITGTGIGESTADRVPALIFRRKAADTAFAWAVALDGRPAQLRVLAVKGEAGASTRASEAAAVQITHGKQSLCLLSNPGGGNRQVSLPDGSTWRSGEIVAIR